MPARDRLALVRGDGRAPVDELVPHDLDRLDALRRRGSRPARRGSAGGSPRGFPDGSRAAKSRRCSRFRFTVCGAASSSASLAGSSSSWAGSTTTSAPASSPSSPTSTGVHAACTGPRRPRTRISRIAGRVDRLDRGVGRVRRRELLAASARASARRRGRRSRSRSRPRARPRGRTRGPGSRGGRCTRRRTRSPPTSRADPRRGCRGAGRSARRRRRRPRRRRSRSSSWVTSRPTSTFPKKRKPGCAAVFSKARETSLMLRVVGRDAEPDEAPRRRQALDQVDLDVGSVAQQRGGGVEAGRARADDGDAQRARRTHAAMLDATRALAARARTRTRRSRPASGRAGRACEDARDVGLDRVVADDELARRSRRSSARARADAAPRRSRSVRRRSRRGGVGRVAGAANRSISRASPPARRAPRRRRRPGSPRGAAPPARP